MHYHRNEIGKIIDLRKRNRKQKKRRRKKRKKKKRRRMKKIQTWKKMRGRK